jgi:hypothetical protein
MPTSVALPANSFVKRDPLDIGEFLFWDTGLATLIDFTDLVAPNSESVSKRVIPDTGKVPFWDYYSAILIGSTVLFITGPLLHHCVYRALPLHNLFPAIVTILAGWAIWSMQPVYPESSNLLAKTLRILISLSFGGTVVLVSVIFFVADCCHGWF